MTRLESKFECLLFTNDLLDELIVAHGAIFSRPLLHTFKAIPFGKLRDKIREILDRVSEIQAAYAQLPNLTSSGHVEKAP